MCVLEFVLVVWVFAVRIRVRVRVRVKVRVVAPGDLEVMSVVIRAGVGCTHDCGCTCDIGCCRNGRVRRIFTVTVCMVMPTIRGEVKVPG